MTDENRTALRTAAGREAALDSHEDRIDDLEGRVKGIEGKEESRDKRWELVLRAVVTIGGGIIIAIVSALLAGGKVPMNDALREAAAVDPEWAKREARRQFLLKATVAGTLLALAIGTVAFVLGFHNAERITSVEHSACQVDAASYECQHTKLEAERAANLQTTCAPFFKAGYPCPRPGSTAAERQTVRRTQRDHPVQGGDASKPHHQGHSQPSPHHGGSGQGRHQGSGGGGKAPAPGPTGSNGGGGEVSNPAGDEGAATGSTGVVQGTVEAAGKGVGEVVGGTGEAAKGTLEGLGDATCKTLGNC